MLLEMHIVLLNEKQVLKNLLHDVGHLKEQTEHPLLDVQLMHPFLMHHEIPEKRKFFFDNEIIIQSFLSYSQT